MQTSIYDLNKEISTFANRKELSSAWNLFKEAYNGDRANIHTYAAMANAAVRCGDMKIAEEVLSLMQAKRVPKDVIICTTLLKGYCSQCSVSKAMALFNEMKKNNRMKPNIRTLNTLLRGLVQSGEVKLAEKLLVVAQKELKIELDSSSWEYLIVLLSQNLSVDKIHPMIGRLKSNPAMQSGMVHIYLELAKACVLLGDWKSGRKALATCRQELLALETQPQITSTTTESAVETDAVDSGKKEVTGGKRAWKSSGKDASLSTDHNRNHSLEIFKRHQRAEWREDIDNLERFLTRRQQQNQDALTFLLPFFHHAMLFNCDTSAGTVPGFNTSSSSKKKKNSNKTIFTQSVPTVTSVSLALFDALVEKFGLDSAVRKVCPGQSVSDLLLWDKRWRKQQMRPVSSSAASAVAEVEKEEDSSDEEEEDEGDDEDDGEEEKKAEPEEKEKEKKKHKPKAPIVVQEMDEKTSRVCDIIKSTKRRLKGYLTSDLYLNFRSIFEQQLQQQQQPEQLALDNKRYKLEVCSGAGEWVVTQAKHDTADSCWVSLELRYDRVYQTFTKMIVEDVRNLCVLAGDAKVVVPKFIAPNSFHEVFVNHPEPPQQTSGHRDDSEAAHLLDSDFFAEMYRILTPGGQLTIVTDNLWYGKLLTRLVAQINNKKSAGVYFHTVPPATASTLEVTIGKNKKPKHLKRKLAQHQQADGEEQQLQQEEASSSSSLASSVWQTLFTEGDVTLYVGSPGHRAGHRVVASSYFDRLWKKSALEDRYFLVLRKGMSTGAVGAATRASDSLSANGGIKALQAQVVNVLNGEMSSDSESNDDEEDVDMEELSKPQQGKKEPESTKKRAHSHEEHSSQQKKKSKK